MILLPSNPQRAWLRSLWAVFSLLEAVLFGALAWLYWTEFLWLVVVAGIVGTAGMIKPGMVVWPYRAWNKLARLYAGLAKTLVLRISFFTVCVPAGWAGSQVQMDRPPAEESLWLPRQSLASTSDKTLQTKVGGREPADGWIVRYVTWVWESREVWRLFLLPFLLLLFLLQSSEEELTVPENTYTLF